MDLYNLVFSDNRKIRLRRHLLFWLGWTIYLTITYLIPTNWIPAWNIDGPMPHLEKYGPVLGSFRILWAAVLHTAVHMLLVYGVLYFILPRYLSKNRGITTLLLFLLICVVAFINYFNFVLAFYLSTRVGFFKEMPGMAFIIPRWGRQVLFNYPTVTGFALAITLMKNWWLKQQETAQAAREKINAELQLLKAQTHPHFLFNTLNNIYSFIINESPAAVPAIQQLSALLHYVIYECNLPLVPLSNEIKMINDYIGLEKIRYGRGLHISLKVRGNTNGKMISPLLLIPFLENSFKHGASQMLASPWVSCEIESRENYLLFNVSNGKPAIAGEESNTKGIGLSNVKKRLALLYPDTHTLSIQEDAISFNILLKVPLEQEATVQQSTTETKMYELV